MKKQNNDQAKNNKMNPLEDTSLYAAGRETDPALTNDDQLDEADITPEDIALLDAAGEDMDDEYLDSDAQLDDVDEDGEPLNEKSSANDLSGDDLDVPGAEEDDTDEAIGEEDEENNGYSLADDQ